MDSLRLMRLSEDAKNIPHALDVQIAMSTETNKMILKQLDLLTSEGEIAASDDITIAMRVDSEENLSAVLASIEGMITRQVDLTENSESCSTVDEALKIQPDTKLAVVSVPGRYARDIAMTFLEKGIHVHLFSDHVPVGDEVELKEFASTRDLFVLGPGAGTSIINGKGIGFANAVRKGDVGIVAAAGTGLQEVSVLLDRIGIGVSHGLGVGGNDISEDVGGIMMLDCIKTLEADYYTKELIIISKAPNRFVRKKIIKWIQENTKKRFVICFLGTEHPGEEIRSTERIEFGSTLHEAVTLAAKARDVTVISRANRMFNIPVESLMATGKRLKNGQTPRQKHIRGLYSGGTLAHEALLILGDTVGSVYSNSPLYEKYKLTNPHVGRGHTIVDMGDETFTASRAHPMIDPTLRKLRILEEARDPTVAVIMMDFILGYGCHPDPVGSSLNDIESAQAQAVSSGGRIAFLAHVCGTEQDPQPLSLQEEKLTKAGVEVFPTNAIMVLASAAVVMGDELKQRNMEILYDRILGGR